MIVLERIGAAHVYYEGLKAPADGLELDVVWRRCSRCNDWWAYPSVSASSLYRTCAPCLQEALT